MVPANTALRLRAVLDFVEDDGTKRIAGDEWLFEGPGTNTELSIFTCLFLVVNCFERGSFKFSALLVYMLSVVCVCVCVCLWVGGGVCGGCVCLCVSLCVCVCVWRFYCAGKPNVVMFSQLLIRVLL